MAHTAYPTGANLEQFLLPHVAALGKTLPRLDFASRIGAAKDKIEGQIGRKLLSRQQVRRFDPPTNPRGVIDLKADLVSVTSVTVAGQTMTADTDYVLQPYGADLDGKPFRWIEFLQRFWPQPLMNATRKSVLIDGLWGFSAEIPEECWDAILCQGAIDCYPEIALSISRGLQMLREGDVEEMYARGKGNGPLVEELTGWQMRVDDAINNFQLVEVGL